MSVVSAARQELVKGILILLTGHECGRESLHEALGELAVSSVDDTLELRGKQFCFIIKINIFFTTFAVVVKFSKSSYCNKVLSF